MPEKTILTGIHCTIYAHDKKEDEIQQDAAYFRESLWNVNKWQSESYQMLF